MKLGEELYKETIYESPSRLLSKVWRDRVLLIKPSTFKTIIEPISVKLDFRVMDSYKKDLDNLVKGALDLLTDRGIISDDALVCSIESTKHAIERPEREKIHIKIYRWVG